MSSRTIGTTGPRMLNTDDLRSGVKRSAGSEHRIEKFMQMAAG